MFRSCLMVMTLVLLVAVIASSSQAQSGRGRQLRLQGLTGGESVAPTATKNEESRQADDAYSKRSTIEVRRNGAWIYNDSAANEKKDDGDYKMTKGDKRAGWILLGLLVLSVGVIVTQD